MMQFPSLQPGQAVIYTKYKQWHILCMGVCMNICTDSFQKGPSSLLLILSQEILCVTTLKLSALRDTLPTKLGDPPCKFLNVMT